MAYYPIKCPYCLNEQTNQDVRFDLRRGIKIKESNISDDFAAANSGFGGGADDFGGWADGGDVAAENSWDGDDWDSSSRPTAQQSQPTSAQTTQVPTEGFFTFAEMQRFYGAENIKPLLNREIYAPPALAVKGDPNDEMQMHLLTGLEVTKREGNKEIISAYFKRYCGECHKELMSTSGMKASYVLLMLGPTSSGKTMFLVALHMALGKDGGGYLLPPRNTGSLGVAKLFASPALGSSEKDDTSLEAMADDLMNFGKLPLSTFSLGNEPLALDIQVQLANGKSNDALLFLRDMPGEFLLNPEKSEELYRIAYQFPKFDGFIMMLDPFTFAQRAVFMSDGSADTTDASKLRFVQRLNQVLTNTILPLVGSNRVQKPTAVVVTKGDHFFNRDNAMRLKQMGIEYNMPTLNSYQIESYDRVYFQEADRDVQYIIQNLSQDVMNMLERNFGNMFFSVVSALSKVPLGIAYNVEGGKGPGDYVTTPAAIRPWRVVDPFMRMLMQLNIVPPFDQVEIRTPNMEPRELALGRNTRYLAAMNAWGKVYCNGWDDFSGVVIESLLNQPQVQGKPPKKGK